MKTLLEQDHFVDRKGLKSKSKKLKTTNAVSVNLKPNELQSLLNDTDVAFVEENAIMQVASTVLQDTYSAQQTLPWGIRSIGADLALGMDPKGKTIKIAVLDTGIVNHPDLQVTGGVSFVENRSDYTDDNGHGTHIAGTIVALNNNMGVVGVAPQAEVFAVKVLDQNGIGYYDQIIQGIEWSIEHDVNIISMSLGGSQYSQALHEIIQKAVNQGILIIAAAGNHGLGTETELYPARYPEVISVGAVNKFHQRAAFSSTGAELDLVAPGTEILITTKDGSYGILSGTSMAAPHVAAASAVLWTHNPELTNHDIKNKLYETATYLGISNEYGHGLLNLAKALGLIDKPIPPFTESAPIIPPGQSDLDINQLDVKLLGLSKKLQSLRSRAIEENNNSLAKKIDQSINDLLITNSELHQLPENLDKMFKDTKFKEGSVQNIA